MVTVDQYENYTNQIAELSQLFIVVWIINVNVLTIYTHLSIFIMI